MKALLFCLLFCFVTVECHLIDAHALMIRLMKNNQDALGPVYMRTAIRFSEGFDSFIYGFCRNKWDPLNTGDTKMLANHANCLTTMRIANVDAIEEMKRVWIEHDDKLRFVDKNDYWSRGPVELIETFYMASIANSNDLKKLMTHLGNNETKVVPMYFRNKTIIDNISSSCNFDPQYIQWLLPFVYEPSLWNIPTYIKQLAEDLCHMNDDMTGVDRLVALIAKSHEMVMDKEWKDIKFVRSLPDDFVFETKDFPRDSTLKSIDWRISIIALVFAIGIIVSDIYRRCWVGV